MDDRKLSPLAAASRDLVLRLSTGATSAEVEAGCRELIVENTNGFGTADTQVVQVASEIVRGILHGITTMRSPAIFSATRGVCESGAVGEAGDAERLGIAEQTCRDVRDSDDASYSDYRSALDGAASAARMTADDLHERISRSPLDRDTRKDRT